MNILYSYTMARTADFGVIIANGAVTALVTCEELRLESLHLWGTHVYGGEDYCHAYIP